MESINVRKEFFEIIKPYFNDRKYKFFNNSGDPSFVKVNQDIVVHFFFNFSKIQGIRFSMLRITHLEVEDIILEISGPNWILDDYLKKDKYFLTTVEDKNSKINFREFKKIETKKLVQEYAKAIKQYTEINGKAFLDKYSHLPNLLIEMDKLEQEGKYWNSIIAGGPDFLFRGLIISKLCNDYNFNQKLRFVDSLFIDVQNNLKKWQPYYEQLKLKLSALSPKYNL